MRKFKTLVTVALVVLLAVTVFPMGISALATKAETSRQNAAKGEAPVAQVQADENGTQSQEMAAYLFVHFVGTEGSYNDEQVYFSVSQDGTHWQTLNKKKPILTSDVGEKGIRDPHIVRSPNGDKFYMIATDLSIHHGHDYSDRPGGWGSSQTNGSHSIVIWESEDLVNWSEPRLREIARKNAGCTWAPESIWDNERNAYMVFWASKTQEDWTHRLYRCYTTDFDTFTEPEVYIEGDVSLIDTTFIKEGDTYYRFTKDEHATYVYMEKSNSLNGDFTAVSTYSINGAPAKAMTGYEGPTVYKLNGQNKWCLLLDNYGTGSGYKPFITDDIATGKFVSGEAFDFGGTKFRHGTVMPITQAEYDALIAEYPVA